MMRFMQRSRTTPRKQAYLTCQGVLYIVLGIGYTTPAVDRPSALEPYSLPLVLAPMVVWGTIWACVGAFAVVMIAFGRCPIGYTVIAAWSVGWAMLCVGSSIFLGSNRGWLLGAIFFTFGLCTIFVDGMDKRRGPIDIPFGVDPG